jgi:hypothetical protein
VVNHELDNSWEPKAEDNRELKSRGRQIMKPKIRAQLPGGGGGGTHVPGRSNSLVMAKTFTVCPPSMEI